MSGEISRGEPLRTAYVTHSDCSRHDTGWGHPEHQGRLPAVARAVHADMLTLFDHLVEIEGVPAERDALLLAHSATYIDRVQRRCREAGLAGEVRELDGEVRVSGASWDAVLAAVGCALTAARAVATGEARNAFCAVRPPGHGAGRDSPGAYGIFNSVAIAALALLQSRQAARVLVVEWGSGAGFGTARILAPHAGARMLSLYHPGEVRMEDVAPEVIARPLGAESDGSAVLAALRDGLDEATRGFAPDFILLSLGCDALASDPRGGLALAPGDYHGLTSELRARAEELAAGRLVSVLEEGYDASASGRAVVQHLRALAGLEPA